MSTIDQKTLRKLLHYDKKTGIFTWKQHLWRSHIGAKAGWLDKSGYKYINIGTKKYPASRLAFLWVTGSFPENHCDHKDGNPGNDSWENLREATVTQNLRNKRVQSNNKLGLKGVVEHLPGVFRSRIKVNDRQIHLGLFATPEEAHRAYVAAANKHFGAFARG